MAALVLLLAAQFMVVLDVTVVNVALPSIQADLGFAFADLQWVVTAYTLAFGGLLLLGGRAADRLGRRRTFVAGLGLFTAASLASGLAASPEMLLVSRAAQGVGAALLSPAALSLIMTLFPEGPRRHRALAAWAAVGAAGAAVGVLLGGALTEAFGWGAIFLVNVPIGIAVALAAGYYLPAAAPTTHGRFDAAGALAATTSLVALIYALVDADSAGWGSLQTLGLLAVAAAGLCTFAAIEAVVSQPLVPLALFRRRATVTALLLMMLGMGTLVSGFYFSSLYLQQVLGHSALRTGLEFLPVAAAIVLAAHVGGHVTGRVGAKPAIATGLAVGAAGALLLSQVSADGSYATDVLPGLVTLAAGVGLALVGITVTAVAGAGHHESGLVSGLTSTAHELGIALVLSVLSTIAVLQLDGNVGAAEAGPSTAGFADAYRAAALVALTGAILALTSLRRTDVAPGMETALVHH